MSAHIIGKYYATPPSLSDLETKQVRLDSTGAIAVGTSATSLGKAEDAAHVSGDTGVFVLALRTDTPASSAGTTGDYAAFNTDSLGHLWVREGFADGFVNNGDATASVSIKPLATNTYNQTLFQNLGANITLNVKSSAGNVFKVMMENVSGAPRYLQLHNTATTPGGAAVPQWTSPAIPPGGNIILGEEFFALSGMFFTTGIAFACSTTAATYTAAVATDHIFHCRYK